jgi:hypothetical protein
MQKPRTAKKKRKNPHSRGLIPLAAGTSLTTSGIGSSALYYHMVHRKPIKRPLAELASDAIIQNPNKIRVSDKMDVLLGGDKLTVRKPGLPPQSRAQGWDNVKKRFSKRKALRGFADTTRGLYRRPEVMRAVINTSRDPAKFVDNAFKTMGVPNEFKAQGLQLPKGMSLPDAAKSYRKGIRQMGLRSHATLAVGAGLLKWGHSKRKKRKQYAKSRSRR